ncbi:multidrug resistance outer membrane protein [Escherichia coli]|nr:multidrug resistance outer membrane protein [Escherichia coli]
MSCSPDARICKPCRWYVQASLDQVDSARALFYPSFDIKAFFGLDSIHLHTLFKKNQSPVQLHPGSEIAAV